MRASPRHLHASGDGRLSEVRDPGLELVRQLIDEPRPVTVLGEQLARALHEAGPLARHYNPPAVFEEGGDVLDSAVGVAGEARNRVAFDLDREDLARVELLLRDLQRLERGKRPPRPRPTSIPQSRDGEEVAGAEVDGRVGASRGRAPGCLEELVVGLGEVHGTRRDSLGREHGHGGVLRQVARDRDELAHERRGKRLHALRWDALGDLGEHLLQVGELVLHLACALAHALREE